MYSLMVVKIDCFTDSADRSRGTSGRTSMGANQRARCYGQEKQHRLRSISQRKDIGIGCNILPRIGVGGRHIEIFTETDRRH